MAEKETAASGSIWYHITELRSRLLKAVIALAITSAVSFYLGERLIYLLVQPLGGIDKVQSIEVTENIGVFMRVSLLSGFILGFPFILYQLLAFVLPGLTSRERKWLLWSIPFATILFVCGVAFSYFFMLPTAVTFLVSFMGIPNTPRLSNYINFVTSLLFWSGVSFEMPLLVFILAKLRFVTGRILLRYWRVAIVLIAILAAFISPTVDPINMVILMAPLIFLYFLSVLMAFIAVPKKDNTTALSAKKTTRKRWFARRKA
ncbi:MAG: twin-arginine translocase subunit TatC [Anaerolineae bacterium]|nr:twin-arginine translocase subunit TatC [Anaerolineae bacterium]